MFPIGIKSFIFWVNIWPISFLDMLWGTHSFFKILDFFLSHMTLKYCILYLVAQISQNIYCLCLFSCVFLLSGSKFSTWEFLVCVAKGLIFVHRKSALSILDIRLLLTSSALHFWWWRLEFFFLFNLDRPIRFLRRSLLRSIRNRRS